MLVDESYYYFFRSEEMSTLVRFFYGSDTVQTNDHGVDLSEF